MNKPLQQGAQATYGQPMPSQTLMPPHNTTPSHAHNNHFALNVPNAGGANATTLVTGGGATQNYTTNPPASSHPVAAGSTNTSFNTPPKVGTTTTNIFGGGSANYSANSVSVPPITQSLPATGQLDEKTSQPQSNGTAVEAVRAAGTTVASVANSGKVTEVNHSSPKKELPVAASPEKPRGSPEKPAATLPTVEVKVVTEAKTAAGEPAQAVAAVVPNIPSPTLASPSTTTPSTISSPNPASSITPTKPDNPVTSAVAVTTTPPSTATSSSTTSTDGATAVKVDGLLTVEKSDKVVMDGCVTPVKETTPTSTSVPTVVVATTADSTTPVSPIKPKDQSTPTKPVSTMKLATTPRTPSRKVKEQLVLKTPKHDTKVAAVTSSGGVGGGGGGGSQKSPSSAKGKRHRIRTQPYQSPIPELEIISKLTRKRSPRTRNVDEKLIIFYKNEFLAVRNSEGGFYVCQAVQNIYKHSAKIKIRWLSQDKSDKSGEMYTPDFYDFTDFDCILTNLNLVRMDKGKYRLPAEEKDRTDNILTRAIAVEKGDAAPLDDSLTEEHPDGLDVSLYKDEEQLNIKSRTGTKRKATSTTASSSSTPRRSRATSSSPSKRRSAKSARLTPKKASATTSKTPKKTIASTSSPQVKATQRKATSTTSVTVVKAKTPTKVSKKKKGVTTPVATSSGAKAAISSVGRAERAKRRQDTSPQAVSASGSASVTKNSPVLDQKKAKMLAKVVKRSAISMKVATLPPKSNSKPVVKTSTASAAPSKKTTNKPAVVVLATRKTKRTRK